MERKQHLIFDSYDTCSEDNMKKAKQYLLETWEEDEITEEMIYNCCYADENIWFEDALSNMENLSEGSLIAIADVGTWRGRFSGYKEVASLKDVMYHSVSCEYQRIYVDSNGDLRKDESHHDGSNSILYRYWKDGITDNQRGILMDKIFNGKCTQRDITRYTRKAGLEIACCYGWKVRGTKRLTVKA